MSYAFHLRNPQGLIKQGYIQARELWDWHGPAGRERTRKRAATDRLLNALGRESQAEFRGRVLVDGMWDNPNYWMRFSLLRAGLGLSHGQEIGLLGRYRRKQCQATFASLGICKTIALPDMPLPRDTDAIIDDLLTRTRTADDVLAWSLPGAVHPALVYDAILKLQRKASVDPLAPEFPILVKDALRTLLKGAAVLDHTRPDLVVISHPLNVSYGGVAWQALARGIPVVLPFGLFGVLRFTRFFTPEDLFAFYDRPTRKQMEGLEPQRAAGMAEIGHKYLAERMNGRADDLAAIFAFRKNNDAIDRARLCAQHGWDPDRPIVAFYASNWFDWPHQLGMTQFRDFLDWTEATFAAAVANRDVNWLFKPHPAEDWFGGVALADILRRFNAPPHIAIAEKRWNNTAVMAMVDAMVTYHGTAGVEFAALGKPVLVPDRGKYDDCGFVRVAKNRSDYLELLGRRWWDAMNLGAARNRAEIFAGWWFCAPDWQDGFVISDDARQDELYDVIPSLLEDNRATVAREIDSVRTWWSSGERYYHTWKMASANAYRLTNLQ